MTRASPTGNGLGADMEAAIRMNASAVAIQCFIGGAGEARSLETLCRAVDTGERIRFGEARNG